MYTVYNKPALTRNQRFLRALLFGALTALGCAVAYGFLSGFTRFEFSIVFLVIGWVIGMVIQKTGHGVQLRFSILGAILAALCFLLADAIRLVPWSYLTGLGDFFAVFPYAIYSALASLFSAMNLNTVLAILFRAGGIYAAFFYSRVVG